MVNIINNTSEEINSEQKTDYNYSKEEDLKDYKINDPVNIGDILIDRYIIKQKLDYDNYNKIWLALDNKINKHVTIKIQKLEDGYIKDSYNEIEILKHISKKNFDKKWIKSLKEYYNNNEEELKEIEIVDNTKIVELLNTFEYKNKDGKYLCMVFEIMGVNLLDIMKRFKYKGIPLPIVRNITKQILIGLDFLHRICRIIHTDIRPENILVCLTQDELKNIQKTGTYIINNEKDKEFLINNNIDEKEKDNDDDNELKMYVAIEEDVNFKGINGKKLRKKRQKYKQKQKKIFEKYGLSNNEINEKIDDVMNDVNDKIHSLTLKYYDINDIIERPRPSSTPKVKLHLQNKDHFHELNESYSEESEESESLDIDNILYDPSNFDFDLSKYKKYLQNYINEKKLILNNEDYRIFAFNRSKAISQLKTEEERNSLYNKLNEEYENSKNGVDQSIKVKIFDMGNACWINHHFRKIIQTRQYRSPEVILKVNYTETADIWSLGCMIFELVTGNYLFNPEKGDIYTINDDHISKFIEILGKIPKNFAKRGKNYYKYFDEKGKMRRIEKINHIGIKDVLITNYHIKEFEAEALSDFLMKMLEYYPEKRSSARELLKHPWLNMPPNYDYKMNELDIYKIDIKEILFEGYNHNNKKTGILYKDIDSDRDIYSSDSELNEGDCEGN